MTDNKHVSITYGTLPARYPIDDGVVRAYQNNPTNRHTENYYRCNCMCICCAWYNRMVDAVIRVGEQRSDAQRFIARHVDKSKLSDDERVQLAKIMKYSNDK